MAEDLKARIRKLARWIYESRYPVFFTGAGISTESGMFDYRGPDGVWTRQEKGLPPKQMEKPLSQMEPNRGHYALVELQKLGKRRYLISQNVDNLHLKSGIKPVILAELHGNVFKVRCQSCGRKADKSVNLTKCMCGGKLEDSVVNFGQSMPRQELEQSFEHSGNADLFVVLGSSLTVTPAADLPKEALNNGSALVIVNRDARDKLESS